MTATPCISATTQERSPLGLNLTSLRRSSLAISGTIKFAPLTLYSCFSISILSLFLPLVCPSTLISCVLFCFEEFNFDEVGAIILFNNSFFFFSIIIPHFLLLYDRKQFLKYLHLMFHVSIQSLDMLSRLIVLLFQTGFHKSSCHSNVARSASVNEMPFDWDPNSLPKSGEGEDGEEENEIDVIARLAASTVIKRLTECHCGSVFCCMSCEIMILTSHIHKCFHSVPNLKAEEYYNTVLIGI